MRKIVLVVAALLPTLFSAACETAPNSNTSRIPTNSTNNAAPAPAANAAAIETEIKKLVTDTAAALAKNDAAALDKMYADNYMLVNLDGSVQNKSERLGSIRSGDTKFDSFAYDEVTVRSNPEGTGAVSIARATASGMNKGRRVEGTVRVTQVWSKTKDGWRQVSGHATQIAAGGPGSPPANSAAPSNNSTNGSSSTNTTNTNR